MPAKEADIADSRLRSRGKPSFKVDLEELFTAIYSVCRFRYMYDPRLLARCVSLSLGIPIKTWFEASSISRRGPRVIVTAAFEEKIRRTSLLPSDMMLHTADYLRTNFKYSWLQMAPNKASLFSELTVEHLLLLHGSIAVELFAGDISEAERLELFLQEGGSQRQGASIALVSTASHSVLLVKGQAASDELVNTIESGFSKEDAKKLDPLFRAIRAGEKLDLTRAGLRLLVRGDTTFLSHVVRLLRSGFESSIDGLQPIVTLPYRS